MKNRSNSPKKWTKQLALTGWRTGLELAREKGAAPLMEEDFTVTGEMLRKRPEMRDAGYSKGDSVKGKVLLAKYSRYMQKLVLEAPDVVAAISEDGCRFHPP